MLRAGIVTVVVLLMVLLCLTRVGVRAAFGGGEFRLDARVGPLRIHILPAKAKKPKAGGAKKGKGPKEPKGPKKPKKPKEAGAKPSIAWEDVRDALRTLLPALGRALRRIGRGIRIDPLRLSLVLGGQEDPAASARLFGELQAAVWGGMPRLEELMDIREPYIHMDVDFLSTDTAAEGEAGVTFRIGTLIALGSGLAVPALGWYLRWRKRRRKRPPGPERAGGPEELPVQEVGGPAA